MFKWRTICVVCTLVLKKVALDANESNAHGLHNGDVHLHVFVVLLLCCYLLLYFKFIIIIKFSFFFTKLATNYYYNYYY